MQRLKQQYGENSEEYRRQVARVRDLETSNNEARRAMNRLQEEMDETQQSSSKLRSAFSKVGDKISGMSGPLMGLSTAAAGVGTAMGALAIDISNATDNIESRLETLVNGSEAKLKKMKKNIMETYTAGLTTDLDETTNIAARTEQRGIADKDKQKAIDYATVISKNSDLEGKEIVDVLSMLQKKFGMTIEQAGDYAQRIAQTGIEDFDQAMEYIPQLKDGGLSIDEIIARLEGGMKSGAWNSDKTLDLLAEGQKKVVGDGADAYKEFGLGTEYAKFQAGEIDYKAFMMEAKKKADKLPKEDKKAFWAAIFGTQGEDIDLSSINGIFNAKEKSGKAEKGQADDLVNKEKEKAIVRLTAAYNKLKKELLPLGNTLMNTGAAITEGILPYVKQLIDWFNGLSDTQQKIAIGAGVLAVAMGPLTIAFKVLAMPIKLAWSAIKGLFSGLKLLVSFLPSMSTVMSGLGKAVDIAYKPIVWLGNGLSKLWNVLKFIAPFIRTGLVTAFRALLGPVGLVITAVSLLVAGFKYAYKHSETFRNFVNKLRDSLLNTWNNLKAMGVRGVVAAMWKSVKGAFASGYTFVKTKIEGAKNAISNAWTNARKLAVAKVTGMWTSTKNLFSSGYNAVKSRMASVKNSVSNAWTNTKKATTDKVSSMWTSTKNSFSNGYNAVKNRMSNVKTAMSNSWTAIKKLTVEKVTNMIDHVKKMPQRMADAIAKGAGALKNGGKKLLKGLIGGVEWGLNKVIKGVNQVMTWVGADDSKLKPVDLTKYAKGTPNGGHDGGLAMVNDAPGSNYRELVVLPNGQTFVPKGRNVVMNLPQGAEVLPGHKTRDLAKRGVIPQYKSGVGDTLSGLWSSTKSGASKLWQGTKDVSSAAFNKVKDWSTEVWDWVTSPEKVKKLLMNTIGNVIPKQYTSGIMPSMLNGMMGKLVDQAKDFVFNIADSMGGGADFGSWSPFNGDFNKISNKWNVYDFLYDLAKQIVSANSGLSITSGQRDGATTKSGSKSEHGSHRGIDISGWGSNGGYLPLAKSVAGHPYLKYAIGDNRWNPNNDDKFSHFKWGGHMNHLHLSAKSPAEAKAAKGSFGAASNVSGGAKAWTAQIKKAHQAIYGKAISKQGLNEVLEQIQTESGGNATVRQGIVDVNTHNGSGGAKGLLQFIQSTFDNYKLKGHGNIFSGYDQLLAMFNIKEWYAAITRAGKGKGWSPRGPRVKPYANGGIITKAHMGLVGEDGPEAIIPLDKAKKGRSMQLLAQASQYLNGNKATTSTASSVEGIVAAIMVQGAETSKKLDALIALLASGTTIQIDGKEIANVVNRINQTNERMANRAKGVTT